MDQHTLFALLALTLVGCIQTSATTDDPERDAAPDASVQDAADAPEPIAVPDPEPGPGPDCDAFPNCPPGYDRVQDCEPGGICETVMECGNSILCQVCPPGAGLVCPQGTYEVDECTNDGSCFGYSDCAGSISCESCEVCPEGMIRADDCPPGVECHQCQGDGDGIYPVCVPEDWAMCPPHSNFVDGCLPEDPLCRTLDDGRTCASELCPIANPCGAVEARPVDECAPDALGCYAQVICGEVLTCEVVSYDCDDCEPSCPMGTSPVARCALDGRECIYIAECCAELFCQADR